MNPNVPSGTIRAYAGSSAPSNYLLCDGTSYLRATYQALFDVIGTTYGSADGTHFNVPDARGFVLVGKDAGVAEFNALANTGGAKTINLQHSHTANAHTHTVSGASAAGGSSSAGTSSNVTVAAQSHTHTVTINVNTQSDTGSNNQLSSTQSILNPYLVMNWIIRI